MRISLGVSENVKPLFNIKYDKKDEIFSDVYYRLCYENFQNGKEKRISGIYIDIPKEKIKRKDALKKQELIKSGRMSENMFLLSFFNRIFSVFRWKNLGKCWSKSTLYA